MTRNPDPAAGRQDQSGDADAHLSRSCPGRGGQSSNGLGQEGTYPDPGDDSKHHSDLSTYIWLPTCLREEPAAAGKQLGRNEQKRGAMSLNPLLYQLVNICRCTGEVFSSANNDAYFINNSVMMLVRGEMNMDDIVQIVLMFCSFTCSCGMAHTCRCQRNTP